MLNAGPGLRYDDRAPALAISPTGTTLAWSACNGSACQLYVRSLDQLDRQSRFRTPRERQRRFSRRTNDGSGSSWRKAQEGGVGGGAPSIIADASQPFGATWLPDGRIVYAASMAGGLMRVSESGGSRGALTPPDAAAGEIRHVFPAAVRDGDAVLFTIVTSPLPSARGRLALLRYPAGARGAPSLRPRTSVCRSDMSTSPSPGK